MLPERKQDKRGRGQSAAYKAAPRHEARLAALVDGKLTRGSGSQGEKGDVRVRGKLRIEAKSTGHKSFSVTAEMLEKIENAVGPGELPVLSIDFVDGRGKVLKSVYVVPDYAMDEMMKVYRGS